MEQKYLTQGDCRHIRASLLPLAAVVGPPSGRCAGHLRTPASHLHKPLGPGCTRERAQGHGVTWVGNIFSSDENSAQFSMLKQIRIYYGTEGEFGSHCEDEAQG